MTVLWPGPGVARVGGARIAVAAFGGGGAGAAAEDDRVLADARLAGVDGARVAVVAVGVDRARPAVGDRRAAADAGVAGLGRAGVAIVAVGSRGALGEGDVDAGLAAVAADLVLVAVVDHELEAVGVAHHHGAGGDEIVDVPAHLGAVALVLEPARGGIAGAEVPVVLGRIGVGGDGDDGGGVGGVDGADGGLPGAEDGVRRERGPAHLPVAGAAGGVGGDVGEEEGGVHGPVAAVGIAGAGGGVGAGLGAVEERRADGGVGGGARALGERGDGVVRRGGALGGLDDHPADAEDHGVLVVVPGLDGEAGGGGGDVLGVEGAEDL